MRLTISLFLAALVIFRPSADGATLGGKQPAGFAETFGLGPEQVAKDYSVQQFAASVPASSRSMKPSAITPMSRTGMRFSPSV